MATRLPGKVLWDPCAAHHWQIVVRRDKGYMSVACIECDDLRKYSLESRQSVWALLQRHPEVQVVVWIEMEGECSGTEAIRGPRQKGTEGYPEASSEPTGPQSTGGEREEEWVYFQVKGVR